MVIAITVRVKGIKRLTRFTAKLPKELNKEISKDKDNFMKRVLKSAKLRAPRMTGALAQSIRLKITKIQTTLIVDSPYGIFQEEGYPPHWVHAWTPTRNSLGTIGAAYNVGGWLFVSKHTPFVKPALEANINKLQSILNSGAKRAIKKAGG